MNIRAFPDTTGYAPASERWHAIDMDTYDGADDGPPCLVGYGPTPGRAMEDLLEQMQDES